MPPKSQPSTNTTAFTRSPSNTLTLTSSTIPKPHIKTSHLCIFPTNPEAGTILLTSQTGLDPAANRILHPDSAIAQMKQIMRNISALLQTQGLGTENIVRCRMYLVDRKDLVDVQRVWAEFVKEPWPPGMVLVVGEGGLVVEGARVEVEVDAVG